MGYHIIYKKQKKIDGVQQEWDFVKIYTNPYEFIHTHVQITIYPLVNINLFQSFL